MNNGKPVNSNHAAFRAAFYHSTNLIDGEYVTDYERLNGARYHYNMVHPDAPYDLSGCIVFKNNEYFPVSKSYIKIHPVNKLHLLAALAYAEANGEGDVWREVNKDLMKEWGIK